MADNQIDKLLIALGYDTTGLDKGAKEAIEKTQALNQEFTRATGDLAGQQEIAGAKAGKNFAKAYGREIMFLRSILTKYLGPVGDIIGDALGLFTKFGQSRWANELLPTTAGSATGTTMGTATAAGAGAVAGGGLNKLFGYSRTALPHGGWMETMTKYQMSLQLQKMANDIFLREFEGKAAPGLGAQSRIGDLITRSRLGFSKIPYLGALGRVAVPGWSAAGALAPVAAMLGIGASREAERKKEIEGFQTSKLVDEINNIKDPIQRTKRILEEFGKDGQVKFREMEESVKKFHKTLDDKSAWRGFSETMGQVWSSIKTGSTGLWDTIKNGIGTVGNTLASVFGQNVTDDLARRVAESAAGVLDLQRKADVAAAKRVEWLKDVAGAVKEADSLQDQLSKKKFEELSLEAKLKSLSEEKIIVENELANLKGKDLVSELQLKNRIEDIEKSSIGLIREKIKVSQELADIDRERSIINQNINDRMSSRWGLSQLAGVGGWKPETITGPWTRQGMENIMLARQILNREGWAQRYALEGRSDLAQRQMSLADELRGKLDILTGADRDPARQMNKQLDELNKKQAELLKKLSPSGDATVRIPNG